MFNNILMLLKNTLFKDLDNIINIIFLLRMAAPISGVTSRLTLMILVLRAVRYAPLYRINPNSKRTIVVLYGNDTARPAMVERLHPSPFWF